MLLSSSDTRCIFSCLQIPPRENWFQYVRRVYATAIKFPCIITLAWRVIWCRHTRHTVLLNSVYLPQSRFRWYFVYFISFSNIYLFIRTLLYKRKKIFSLKLILFTLPSTLLKSEFKYFVNLMFFITLEYM